jgi:hypothetical protein
LVKYSYYRPLTVRIIGASRLVYRYHALSSL